MIVTLAVASPGQGPLSVLMVFVLGATLHLLWRLIAFVEIDADGLRVLRLGRQRFRWHEVAAFECAESTLPRRDWRSDYLVKMHLVNGAVITLPAPRADSQADEDFLAALRLLRSHLDEDPGQPPERWPTLPVPPPAR
jgi:hypothetical protein